jgi:hypothetical protein
MFSNISFLNKPAWVAAILLVGCQIFQSSGVSANGFAEANTNPPRGALILTMAGSGAPSYLQASCLSIAASASRFDMLIFHEDNDRIINMPCAANVKKINVHRHGLARLITDAICRAAKAHTDPKYDPNPGVSKLRVKKSKRHKCKSII